MKLEDRDDEWLLNTAKVLIERSQYHWDEAKRIRDARYAVLGELRRRDWSWYQLGKRLRIPRDVVKNMGDMRRKKKPDG